MSMMSIKTCLVLVAMLASTSLAQAQKSGGGVGGTATTGTGVRTGQGPLAQPVPPATSLTNTQQNNSLNSQRPINSQGPAQTNPSQTPFGTR